MKNIAILASGSGTNAENIYKFFANGSRVGVKLIIYDRKNAGVAQRMAAYGFEPIYIPKSVWVETPEKIVELLQKNDIDLVVLAGFLRVIPPELTRAFDHRMLNLHPSLLPAYGGMGMYGHKVHEAVIAAGEQKSGVTVHYVSDDVDGGEILMQEEIQIELGETPESLERKVHTVEYSLYPRAIVAALANLPESQPKSQLQPQPQPQQAENLEAPTETPQTRETAEIHTETATRTPPPMPAMEEWAKTLGVNYDPDKIPPHIPGNNGPNHEENQNRQAANRQAANSQTAYSQYGYSQSPYGPQQPNMQNNPDYRNNQNAAPMPQTYLVWAVIMTVLCCLPAGIVAIIFSSQVTSKYYAGDIEGARKASERAQIWIIVSFVLGVLVNTLYLPLAMISF